MGVPRLLLTTLLVGLALAAPTTARDGQDRPLPDREAFFARARERLATNDLIQSRFSYRERTTELRFNPFGRMGTGPVLVHDVYPNPVEELTYRRLIEKDGEALSDGELAEQDRRYRRTLAEWEARLAREGDSERQVRERKAKEAREKDRALAREAVNAFEFTIAGRDTWEGQPAILVDFAPKPGAPARSREVRVARAFEGRAWVHEYEFEVMKLDATAISDVSFGWGLVGRLYRGSTARLTRRRIAGAWLPVETRFDGDGRAVLFRRLTIRFVRDYYDYKPFDASELPAVLGWDR